MKTLNFKTQNLVSVTCKVAAIALMIVWGTGCCSKCQKMQGEQASTFAHDFNQKVVNDSFGFRLLHGDPAMSDEGDGDGTTCSCECRFKDFSMLSNDQSCSKVSLKFQWAGVEEERTAEVDLNDVSFPVRINVNSLDGLSVTGRFLCPEGVDAPTEVKIDGGGLCIVADIEGDGWCLF